MKEKQKAVDDLKNFECHIIATKNIVELARKEGHTVSSLRRICFSIIRLTKEAPTLEELEAKLIRKLDLLKNSDSHRQEVKAILTSGKEGNLKI